jgi:hypothetical protein
MHLFFCSESLEIRYNLKYIAVNMRIILKWILERVVVCGSGYAPIMASVKHEFCKRWGIS